MGASQSQEGFHSPLREFFVKVRYDDMTIPKSELAIWDFIICYLKWLDSSPTDTGVLHLQRQFWDYALLDRPGSPSPEECNRYLGHDIANMRYRLEGNKATDVHFRLLKAVEQSFISKKMPPKFKYKQTENPAKDSLSSCSADQVPEYTTGETLSAAYRTSTEAAAASQKNATMPPDDNAMEQQMIAEVHSQPPKMLTFFIDVKHDIIHRCILHYLYWKEGPFNGLEDDDFLKGIYEQCRAEFDTRYGHGERLSEHMYEGILAIMIKNMKRRVREKNGGEFHQELVDMMGEFLKKGEIPEEARKHRLSEIRSPPPAYDSSPLGVSSSDSS